MVSLLFSVAASLALIASALLGLVAGAVATVTSPGSERDRVSYHEASSPGTETERELDREPPPVLVPANLERVLPQYPLRLVDDRIRYYALPYGTAADRGATVALERRDVAAGEASVRIDFLADRPGRWAGIVFALGPTWRPEGAAGKDLSEFESLRFSARVSGVTRFEAGAARRATRTIAGSAQWSEHAVALGDVPRHDVYELARFGLLLEDCEAPACTLWIDDVRLE